MKQGFNFKDENIYQKAEKFLMDNHTFSDLELKQLVSDILLKNKELQNNLLKINSEYEDLKEDSRIFSEFYNNYTDGLFRIRETVADVNDPFLSSYKIETVSNSICDLLHLTRKQILDNPLVLANIISSEDKPAFNDVLKYAGNVLQPFNWEGKIQLDKNYLWVRVVACARKLSHDTVLWQGILYNITEQKETRDTLDETLTELSDIIEGARVGTLEWNIQTGKIKFNKIWAENLGYSPIEVKIGQAFLGRNGWKTITHPEDIDYAEHMLKRHFSGELPYHKVEVRMKHKKGHWVWIRQEGKVKTWTPDGKPLLMYGLHFDITTQKNAEELINNTNEKLEKSIQERTSELMKLNESLRLNEVKFRTLTNFTYDWEYWKSPDNKILFMSPSVQRITGYSVEDFEYQPELLDIIIHPDDKKMWEEHKIERHSQCFGDKNKELNFRIITKSGEVKWLSHVCRNITVDDEYLGIRVSNRDITEKIYADYRLQNITSEVEEKERNHFSRELHDGMGPLLSAVKLYFQWLADTTDVDKRNLIIEKGNQSIELAIQTSRELARGLNSQFLTDLGFYKALNNFINQINDAGKLNIEFITNTTERFSNFSELMLYRICTELIKNTITYAKASKVIVNFYLDNEHKTILFQYSDNGIGFDWEKVKMEHKSLGLMNILHRVKILMGSIEINSAVGKGLHVNIHLPLET